MVIVLQDKKLGKRYMIKGDNLDFEVFRESKGKNVEGKKKGEGEWTTMRLYPTTLPYAVYKVLCMILADPDDDEVVCVEAEKARIKLGKVINDRLNEITASLEGDNKATERTCHIVKASRKYVLSDGTESFDDGCSECNTYIGDGDNYCSGCGAKVEHAY